VTALQDETGKDGVVPAGKPAMSSTAPRLRLVADVICELHLGLAEGIAEAAGGSVEVTELIARDPRRAGCRLKPTRLPD
jgi:hypothetical protein